MTRVAPWRIGLAILIFAGLLGFAVLYAPIYFHNLELQNYVLALTQRPDTHAKSDDLIRTWVLDKAASLDLPVKANNVQIYREGESLRIDVRYFVRMSLPGYTVDLHFYPGAGSR